MNKKIYKGYELAEAVDNGILSLEQKVKTVDNMTYFECTIDFVLKDVAKNIMFEYFELLEDNTEEIEELLTIEDYECDKTDIRLNRDKINELVKAVNEIRKDMNKEHCCNCGVEITNENRALHNMCNECKYGIDWEEKTK